MKKIASEEIRQRAIEQYEKGKGTQNSISQHYGINLRTFQRWLEVYRKEGRQSPNPRGHRIAAYHDDKLEELDKLVEKYPDATLDELRKMTGLNVSLMAVKRALDKLGYRFKKNASRKRTKTA